MTYPNKIEMQSSIETIAQTEEIDYPFMSLLFSAEAAIKLLSNLKETG